MIFYYVKWNDDYSEFSFEEIEGTLIDYKGPYSPNTQGRHRKYARLTGMSRPVCIDHPVYSTGLPNFSSDLNELKAKVRDWIVGLIKLNEVDLERAKQVVKRIEEGLAKDRHTYRHLL